MRLNLKKLFPSPAVVTSLFALPLVLAIYFTITRYSQSFITEQQVDYFDVQNNWLGLVFLDQKWIEWFNRFMDFAFWGILAAIILVLAWGVSAAKIAFKNHYAQEKFTNFNQNIISWHRNFFVVLALKILLVVLIIYSPLAIIGKQVPELSAGISRVIQEGANQSDIFSSVVAVLAIVVYQFIIVAAIKTFRHLRSE